MWTKADIRASSPRKRGYGRLGMTGINLLEQHG
jgi:hypothetical protein